MNTESDGSLCRITSSTKNDNNIMVVKTSDDERKQRPNLLYKLISIIPNKDLSETSSVDTDEDVEDMTKNSVSCANNSKDIDTPANKKEKIKVNSFKRGGQRFRPAKNWKQNHPRVHDRSNSDIQQYRPNNLNIPPPNSVAGLSPWLGPPQMSNYPYYPIPSYSEDFHSYNSRDHYDTSPTYDRNLESTARFGPYPSHHFHHNNLDNDFVSNENHWRNDYHSSNYSTHIPNRYSRIRSGYAKTYQKHQRNDFGQHKRPNLKPWKRNIVKSQRVRRNSYKPYSYENRK